MSVKADITQLFTFVGKLFTRCDRQDAEIARLTCEVRDLRSLLIASSSITPLDAPEGQEQEEQQEEPVIEVDALELYVARHKVMAAEIIRSMGL